MTDYIIQKDLDESLDKLEIKLIHHIDKSNEEVREELKVIDGKYEHLITTLDKFLLKPD